MHSNELIREVDEELQRDKLLAFWRRYGTPISAIAIAAILGTAGYTGWQAWQAHRRSVEAGAYFAAEQAADAASDKVEGAKALEQFAANATPGNAIIARLTAATITSAADNQAAAKASLEAAAATPSADPLLRDLASLMVIAREVDAGDPASLIARITPMAEPGQPWRHLARQLLASAQLRAGDRAKATQTLQALASDGEAPAAMQRWARELEQAIAVGSAS